MRLQFNRGRSFHDVFLLRKYTLVFCPIYKSLMFFYKNYKFQIFGCECTFLMRFHALRDLSAKGLFLQKPP